MNPPSNNIRARFARSTAVLAAASAACARSRELRARAEEVALFARDELARRPAPSPFGGPVRRTEEIAGEA